ncbi:hypothetical protein U4I66_16085 [Stenotrophomonas maltophilia]|uniref:hypothetical protein n=1 Tax=Stenotrophomonas maltophilia TaxID=40324 RepID=UPI002ACD007C|nr:hypothetical protein [Stenotrophomonas maltophilia]MDZ5843365.1 hypothetical protein [Stenotrophomonas maltophilia]
MLQRESVYEREENIDYATKFYLKSGVNRSIILVYNTGKMHVQGADSPLKVWAENVKVSIAQGTAAPGVLLPAEIEKFPQTLQERVPACDGVIIWFFQEALRCYKAGSIAGAAFMLGGASEKAIITLIESYGNSIKEESHRASFFSRVNNRAISVKYDEFKRSYKSARTKPHDLPLAQDLEQLLDGAFNFYRHTRNSVGHPQVIPDLDPGVVLANLGQFITYVERIYLLMDFYSSNGVDI